MTAHALLADGGVMAPIGMQLVAMAAKRHVVPFVVLVGIYKLSPLFPHEPGLSFNELKSPAAILTRDDPVVQGAELAGAFPSRRQRRPGGRFCPRFRAPMEPTSRATASAALL